MAGRCALVGCGAAKVRSSAAGVYLLLAQFVSTIIVYSTEVLNRGSVVLSCSPGALRRGWAAPSPRPGTPRRAPRTSWLRLLAALWSGL
eukprot:2423688-Alexandrium_andersonii.AAC.1